MRPVKNFGERIADALIEDGLLFSKQVEELLEQQKKEGTRLLKLIIDKSYVTEQDMAVSMGRVLNTPPINLGRLVVAPEIAELLPRDICQNHKVVPVSRLENKLFLAMADPLNVLAIDDVRRVTRMEVSPMIASEKSIIEKLHNLDSSRGGTIEDIIQESEKQAELESDADNLETVRETIEEVNLDQLTASVEEAPVIKLANLILVQAIKDRASDIHIEPFERMVRLRYRVDGALIDKTPPPKTLQVALTSRLKIMSCLDIAERRLPQDGRMRVKVSGRDFDLRVSFLPTVHGEKCVLRILDKANLSANMETLGLDGDTFRRFRAAVDAPHGLILVTGPTGSGKTTTLYSVLDFINRPDRKIITVEDPVEYVMAGINQVAVNETVGLTFAMALRSMLRQAPNVIMLGEIRDLETATIAINASLTGHLVFSTLHTNDAPSAVTRLIDIGVKPFLVASSTRALMAQRLVRKVCKKCAAPHMPTEAELKALNIDPDKARNANFMKGKGCNDCAKTGNRGRFGIFEMFVIDDEARKLIYDKVPSSVLRVRAREMGMRTLREDGARKVLAGLTTAEEVIRATVGDAD